MEATTPPPAPESPQPPPPPPPAAHGDPSEVIGRRIGAALIDVLLMVALFLLLAFTIGDTETSDGEFTVELTGGPFVLYLLLNFGYYIVMEATSGQTLGKRLLGIRVLKDDGSPPGWGGSAVRNLLRVVDGLCLYIVGLVTMIATKKKQRVGDLAASTVVVRDT